MNKIAQFEALAEQLVEGTFARLFAGQLPPLEVATHIARAMEDHLTRSADGVLQAPTYYCVYLHPQDHETLLAERPSLEKEMARQIEALAEQANLTLESAPVVHTLPSKKMAPHHVRVEARQSTRDAEDVERTREIDAADEEEAKQAEAAAPRGRPFLVLEGKRHVNLQKPVVSIGRALDNDVIIEDPRVSRHHAQLRQRYGHYVLYDLDSSGGTEINSYPVKECVLHSGDVISFAGVRVVYGEDPPTPIPVPDSEGTPVLSSSESKSD